MNRMNRTNTDHKHNHKHNQSSRQLPMAVCFWLAQGVYYYPGD